MKVQVAMHPRLFRFRPSILVSVLATLMAIGLIVAMVRFASGIGAISNLSNTYPWGFWISFDIYTGIAISSGAFLLAAAVYIFDLREFRPLLMPSILTALIGYFMEVLALMVDLGRPERIFNLLLFQNYTSHMLVVGLCVMIYLAILAVEFAPVLLKGVKKEKLAVMSRRFIKPAVILGVVVSTIHQGSLGSLLLIQSAKLHPLWWTPLLPVMFFVSSISIGLAMIIFESSVSSRYFRRGLETQLLEKLAHAIPISLGLYVALKFAQLAFSGDLRHLSTSGRLSMLFWAEIIVGVAIPLMLFSVPRNRLNPRMLLTGAILLLLGMVLNRFNASWFGIQRLENVTYVPSLMEVSISAAIFSFGILAFGLAARYLPLFEDAETVGAHS
ncbi:MAG: Ni/Fe-hydrogenase cytochrome b subunit [Chloroflexota bacterium]